VFAAHVLLIRPSRDLDPACSSQHQALPFAGHLGGLLTGFLLGFVLFIKPQFKWLYRDPAVGPALPYMHMEPPKVRKHKTYQYVLQVSRRSD
jgi:hypothetical protein